MVYVSFAGMANYEMDVDFNFVHSTMDDDSETQDVGRMFVDEPAVQNENINEEANEGNTTKKKTRGKNINKWGVDGERERVKWGKSGVPLWPTKKCSHYSNFIGGIAADGDFYPIDIPDWRNFDVDDNHRRAWERIEV